MFDGDIYQIGETGDAEIRDLGLLPRIDRVHAFLSPLLVLLLLRYVVSVQEVTDLLEVLAYCSPAE